MLPGGAETSARGGTIAQSHELATLHETQGAQASG